MLTHVRNLAGGLVLGSAVLLSPVAPALAAPGAVVEAQVGQFGLVNVAVNNTNVVVPVEVAANICGVNAAVLSAALQRNGQYTCQNDQGQNVVITRGGGGGHNR